MPAKLKTRTRSKVESAIAVRVNGLSKSYQSDRSSDGQMTPSYALQDVSFEVRHGESIGIIGANGSGKSTLLKILAGVTLPTAGNVYMYGRVASILDIGAGFHPDLSGNENVFLNGRLLGFSDKEIADNYDMIVSFSGMGTYMDRPVKNYSNGMYLRLAFSIMAHLDFDIYLLDEVLNVGDAEFRGRIRERMNTVRNQGKTILYVSHNLGEIVGDFDSAIILEKGRLVYHGSGLEAVKRYLDALDLDYDIPWSVELEGEQDSSGLLLRGISIVPEMEIDVDTPFDVKLRFFRAQKAELLTSVGIVIHDTVAGAVMTAVSSNALGTVPDLRDQGIHEISCRFPSGLFAPGTFIIDLYFGPKDDPDGVIRVRRVASFRIIESARNSTPLSIGPLRPKLSWISEQPSHAKS